MLTLYKKIFKLTTQPSSEQFPFRAFDKAENNVPALGPKGNLKKKENSEMLVFFLLSYLHTEPSTNGLKDWTKLNYFLISHTI